MCFSFLPRGICAYSQSHAMADVGMEWVAIHLLEMRCKPDEWVVIALLVFIQFKCLNIYVSVCLSLCFSVCLWLYSPLLDLGRSFSSFIFYIFGRTPWIGYQPIARPLPTHRTAQIQNKRTQTSMPQVGFEHIIPVLERSKTFRATDCATTQCLNC
jgi:hypothetical protein